jgi:hypothetical protein
MVYFQTKNPNEGLVIENILCCYLEYFTALWQILWQFGKFCGNLVYYYPFLVCFTMKNLATLASTPELQKNPAIRYFQQLTCHRPLLPMDFDGTFGRNNSDSLFTSFRKDILGCCKNAE